VNRPRSEEGENAGPGVHAKEEDAAGPLAKLRHRNCKREADAARVRVEVLPGDAAGRERPRQERTLAWAELGRAPLGSNDAPAGIHEHSRGIAGVLQRTKEYVEVQRTAPRAFERVAKYEIVLDQTRVRLTLAAPLREIARLQ
jgi:hypothetical protein